MGFKDSMSTLSRLTFRPRSWSVISRAVVACAVAGTLAVSGAARADSHAAAAPGHGAEHGADGHGADGHDGGQINWFYGFAGESADIEEPSFLFRKRGMPVPLGAYLVNSAVLFYVLYRLGKTPLLAALQQRRQQILQGIEDASRMKAAAAEQLAGYEAKLAQIDADVERIKREMQESAALERQRILSEAKARATRLEKEARELVAQELKAAKERLQLDVVEAAMRGAERLLGEAVTSADHERLSDEYLPTLGEALGKSSLVGSGRPRTGSSNPGAMG
jgi:F-type H+-transporting ATPase subunit b